MPEFFITLLTAKTPYDFHPLPATVTPSLS
jgi:hypothetical protein